MTLFGMRCPLDALTSKIGFCNTKSTLFVAMLRAAGIPAKQHFVNINAKILSGILNPGTEYVDHSYTQVFLNGAWLKVDSYIVDLKLANAARLKLQQENQLVGYGVHRNGVSTWDGTSDAFSQFLNDGSYKNLSTNDYGVFEDVDAFYRSGKG
jgi:transglutaminase-like putative cysteine protease